MNKLFTPALLRLLFTTFVAAIFSLSADAQSWQLITSTAEMGEKEQFVLSTTPDGREGTLFAGALTSRNNLRAQTEPYFWTIEKRPNNRYRLIAEDGTYLFVGTGTELDKGDERNLWMLSFSEENAVILTAEDPEGEKRHIQYETTEKYFKNYPLGYASSSEIYLLKQIDLSAPTIKEEATYFYPEMKVSLTTADADCEIRYTTDGSTPTTESAVYSEPFSIAATTTVKAIAVRGTQVSSVTSRTFSLAAPISVRFGGEQLLGTFCAPYATQLPDGVTAYYAAAMNPESTALNLSLYDARILPPNVPFILQSNQAETATLYFTQETDMEIPPYDQILMMGTCDEILTPTNRIVYALGYNENNTQEFGFCRYIGTTLAANKAYLCLPDNTLPYTLLTGTLQTGTHTCVLATEKDENNQPAGIIWGQYAKNNNKIQTATATEPTQWNLEVKDNGLVIFSHSSCKQLSAKYDGDYGVDLYDKYQESAVDEEKYHYQWEVTYDEASSQYLIGMKNYTKRHIVYNGENIKFYTEDPTNNQNFHIFEVNTSDATSPSAAPAFFSIALPEFSGIQQHMTTPQATGIYSIDGRKRTKVQKGYNIVNGKVIFKK